MTQETIIAHLSDIAQNLKTAIPDSARFQPHNVITDEQIQQLLSPYQLNNTYQYQRQYLDENKTCTAIQCNLHINDQPFTYHIQENKLLDIIDAFETNNDHTGNHTDKPRRFGFALSYAISELIFDNHTVPTYQPTPKERQNRMKNQWATRPELIDILASECHLNHELFSSILNHYPGLAYHSSLGTHDNTFGFIHDAYSFSWAGKHIYANPPWEETEMERMIKRIEHDIEHHPTEDTRIIAIMPSSGRFEHLITSAKKNGARLICEFEPDTISFLSQRHWGSEVPSDIRFAKADASTHKNYKEGKTIILLWETQVARKKHPISIQLKQRISKWAETHILKLDDIQKEYADISKITGTPETAAPTHPLECMCCNEKWDENALPYDIPKPTKDTAIKNLLENSIHWGPTWSTKRLTNTRAPTAYDLRPLLYYPIVSLPETISLPPYAAAIQKAGANRQIPSIEDIRTFAQQGMLTSKISHEATNDPAQTPTPSIGPAKARQHNALALSLATAAYKAWLTYAKSNYEERPETHASDANPLQTQQNDNKNTTRTATSATEPKQPISKGTQRTLHSFEHLRTQPSKKNENIRQRELFLVSTDHCASTEQTEIAEQSKSTPPTCRQTSIAPHLTKNPITDHQQTRSNTQQHCTLCTKPITTWHNTHPKCQHCNKSMHPKCLSQHLQQTTAYTIPTYVFRQAKLIGPCCNDASNPTPLITQLRANEKRPDTKINILSSKHIQKNLKTHQLNATNAATTKQLLYTIINHNTKTGIIAHTDKHSTTIWWHTGVISTLPTNSITQNHNTMQRKAKAQGLKFDTSIYNNILQAWQTATSFNQYTNATTWKQEWTPNSHLTVPIHTLAHTTLPRNVNPETTQNATKIPLEIQQTTVKTIELILQKMTEHNDYDNTATISQNKALQAQQRTRNHTQLYTPTHTPTNTQKTTRRKRKQTEPKNKPGLGDEIHALFEGYERTTPCKITGILNNGYNVQTSNGDIYSITYNEVRTQPTTRQKQKTNKRLKNTTKKTKKRLQYENIETTAPTNAQEPKKKKHLSSSLTQSDSEENSRKRKLLSTQDQSSLPKQPKQGQG